MLPYQQFIQNKLAKLTEIQDVGSENSPVGENIYRIVMSKKFRKYSVTPEYQENIKKAISSSVEKCEPIKFVWVFGGYKLWSLDESPEVDWAELFSMIYFANWLSPITKIYKYGVNFDFFSDDVIVPMMNNVPREDIESYISSFRSLLEFIKPNLPGGFAFEFHRVIDQYGSFEEFKSELDKNIEKLTEERRVTPKELTPEQTAMIDLNVILKKGQEEDPNWRDKVQIMHDAYSMLSKRRPYYRNEGKIMVINTPIPGAIAVGTTKTSVVKFWVGAGALKKEGDGFREYVLSPKQLEVTKTSKEPVGIMGLGLKNFSYIKIFE